MPEGDVVPGLVSVIIPVFNREALLREAIACVDAQTYPTVEIVLVDDGSTDGTGALCDRLSAERPERVKVIHRPNGGPGVAREAGRRAARGEYLQYLDSDDWLAPEKLERQVRTLAAAPEAGVCYCIEAERLSDGSILEQSWTRTIERLDSIFPAFLAGRLWQTPNPLWRRAATDRIGEWARLRVEEDLEYDARAGALGIKPVWCSERLVELRHHSGHRASGASVPSPTKMADRAKAHELIYRHARTAGVGTAGPEMQRFARELFLLSRQCGAAGLAKESRRLFDLAREASGDERACSWAFRGYAAAAKVIGWNMVGRLACIADGIRPERSGP